MTSLFFCDPRRFLQAVEKRKCLYDVAHPDYKNKAVTEHAWLELAFEFKLQSSRIAKMRWKNMRDSYMKHKKTCLTRGITNAKDHKWKWARYIRFLEPFIYRSNGTYLLRKCGTPVPKAEEESIVKKDTESSQLRNYLLPKRYSVSASEESADDTQDRNETDWSDGDPLEPTGSPEPEPELEADLKSEPDYTDQAEETADRTDDEVGHLFMSYAETFRRLSSRRQLLLKGQLASLFLRAELELLQDQGLATESELELLQTCVSVSNAIN